MLGLAEAGQVRIASGDHGAAMAQVDLQLPEVFALFQQMSGIRVPQGMDMGVLVHTAGLEGQAEGALQGAAAHRLGGGGRAQAVVAFGWKEPDRVAMSLPELAQVMEGFFGDRDITVALALAAADREQEALGVEVAHLEAQAFAQPQAAGVKGDQGHMMIQGVNVLEDLPRLLGREDDREFVVRIGADQFDFRRPATAERFFPEELEGANGLGGGLAGDLFLALEEDEVLAELFGGDVLGGFIEMFGELADTGPVGLLGALADRQEPEIVGEGF